MKEGVKSGVRVRSRLRIRVRGRVWVRVRIKVRVRVRVSVYSQSKDRIGVRVRVRVMVTVGIGWGEKYHGLCEADDLTRRVDHGVDALAMRVFRQDRRGGHVDIHTSRAD